MKFLAMKSLGILAAGALAFAASAFTTAEAGVMVDGGLTVIDVTFPLDDAGITANAVGGASITDEGFFSFPVTGGEFDVTTLVGEIFHDGGFSLVVQGAPTTQIRDLVINFNADGTGSIFADLQFQSLMLDDLELFTFDLADLMSTNALFDTSNPTLPLFIAASFADFLDQVFGLDEDELVGELFGFAATLLDLPELEIADVPLPAALPLFIAGLAGLGFAGSSRRRRSV